MAPGRIRVVVVEDSRVPRELLVALLEGSPGFEVVDAVSDGEAGIRAVREHRPSVVTMDLHMPGIDGAEATRRIMREAPTPIILVTASSNVDGRLTYDALAAGALSVVPRPVAPGHSRYDERRLALLDELRLMADVRVVRRHVPSVRRVAGPRLRGLPIRPPKLVAVAASTGGPAALRQLLTDLPVEFDTPIVIVQHLAPGFVDGLARWLAADSGRAVRVARHGDRLAPGDVLLAPDDRHLRLHSDGTIRLHRGAPRDGHRPSATELFESAADAFGGQTIGVILTGMGHDGAAGLQLLHERGALTLAQDGETAAVNGMPAAAVEAGAIDRVVPLGGLGALIGAVGRGPGTVEDRLPR